MRYQDERRQQAEAALLAIYHDCLAQQLEGFMGGHITRQRLDEIYRAAQLNYATASQGLADLCLQGVRA